MKHKAKRIDAGWYEYRGRTLRDIGAGSSVRNAIERHSGRWIVASSTDFNAHTVARTWSLADAKKRVDDILAKEQQA